MTTDNGATAVADETEVTTTETPQSEEIASPDTSTGAGEVAEGSATAETPEGTAEAEGAEIDFSALVAAEFAAQAGGDTPDTPAESKPAGIPVEEWEARERGNLANLNAMVRRDAETFLKGVMRQAGVPEESISQAWESQGRQLWNDFVRSNDKLWEDMLYDKLIGGLSEDQKAAWGKTKHSNLNEYRDKLIDLGRQEVESKHQADIKSGKVLPKTVAEKAGVEAARKAVAARDKQYAAQGYFLAKSGNEVTGDAPRTGVPYSQLSRDQRQAMSSEQRDAYVAAHG